MVSLLHRATIKEEGRRRRRRTNHSMKIYMVYRATITRVKVPKGQRGLISKAEEEGKSIISVVLLVGVFISSPRGP